MLSWAPNSLFCLSFVSGHIKLSLTAIFSFFVIVSGLVVGQGGDP